LGIPIHGAWLRESHEHEINFIYLWVAI
jgi:hypothetical protein